MVIHENPRVFCHHEVFRYTKILVQFSRVGSPTYLVGILMNGTPKNT
jgi:hypothetical protein